MNRKLMIILSAIALLAAAILPAAAAPLAAPCVPGGAYDPACDANQDGVIDVVDIQLTAGHWNQSGTFTSGSWDLTGNAGTNPAANFVGTTDNQPLVFKANNNTALRLLPAGADGSAPNVIGGSAYNSITAGAVSATISGGGWFGTPNAVTDEGGTVGGGASNTAGNSTGSVFDATYATVGGGAANTASGPRSTVGGGGGNTASGQLSAIGGGEFNTASGNYGAVPGGASNTAAGNYSFAAGRRAKANHVGAFVLADSSNFDMASAATNSLRARFTGGMRMIVAIDGNGNYTVNCVLTSGTVSWSCSTSLAAMEGVEAADAQVILAQLSQLPIATWKAGEEGVRHVGPSAEAFHAAFGLGQPGEGISTIDLDGVALASIQALHQLLQEKEAQLADQQAQIDALAARLAALEQANHGAQTAR